MRLCTVRHLLLLCLLILTISLTGCTEDPYEPDIASGVKWTLGPPASLATKAVSGHSLAQVMAVGAASSLMEFDGERWTSLNPTWVVEDRILTGVWLGEDGTAVAYGTDGGVVMGQGDQWRETPFLDEPVYHAEILPDGRLWACGDDGLLAWYDEPFWEVVPVDGDMPTLYKLCRLGPEDFIFATWSFNMLRWVGGEWISYHSSDIVTDVAVDAEGRGLAVCRTGLLRLEGDELVSVQPEPAPFNLRALDCGLDGTVVVAGHDGGVMRMIDDVWETMPEVALAEDGLIRQVYALTGGKILALDSEHTIHLWDGEVWSDLYQPGPGLNWLERDCYG